jgi:hypothetical protein
MFSLRVAERYLGVDDKSIFVSRRDCLYGEFQTISFESLRMTVWGFETMKQAQ